MKIYCRPEQDNWTQEGHKITDPAVLSIVLETLEKIGPIIVQHWLYYRSSAPRCLTFDDYDAFIEYLEMEARAGDAIDVWSFGAVCTRDLIIAEGKCPDDNGFIPQRGAY